MSADYLVEILRKYKVTHITTLPFTIENILQVKNLQPFPHIEAWMVSGFAMTKSLCDQFSQYLPNGQILISYGLTETFIISCNYTGSTGHIGVLNDNITVKVSWD
jgi:acyl-CoA synthetase (AMP-forming)/AMP-acid ligase II